MYARLNKDHPIQSNANSYAKYSTDDPHQWLTVRDRLWRNTTGHYHLSGPLLVWKQARRKFKKYQWQIRHQLAIEIDDDDNNDDNDDGDGDCDDHNCDYTRNHAAASAEAAAAVMPSLSSSSSPLSTMTILHLNTFTVCWVNNIIWRSNEAIDLACNQVYCMAAAQEWRCYYPDSGVSLSVPAQTPGDELINCP